MRDKIEHTDGVDPVPVPRLSVQILLDVVVSSLDFGSGMLDDEEVNALRGVAELLGIDPMIATPNNFRCKHDGGLHQWNTQQWGGCAPGTVCMYCRTPYTGNP
jgi:hypothetical protein